MNGRPPFPSAIAFALFVLAAAAPAPAQGLGGDAAPPPPSARISREVTVLRMEDRLPIGGAEVEAVNLPGGPVKKTTGADGKVRFEDTPAGGVTFVVRAAGRPWATFAAGTRSLLSAAWKEIGPFDGVRSIPILLMEGTALEGRVVSSLDGKPIPGVRVEGRDFWGRVDRLAGEAEMPSFDDTAFPLWVATTDADGRFRTDQAPNPYPDRLRFVSSWVLARCPGWCPDGVEIPQRNEGLEPVDLRLCPAGVIRGRVLQEDGSPAAGALVRARREVAPAPLGHWWLAGPLEASGSGSLRTRSGTDGRFEFSEVAVGVRYTLAAAMGWVPPFLVPSKLEMEMDMGPITARSSEERGVTVPAQGGVAVRDLRLRRLATLLVKVSFDGGDIGVGVTVDLLPLAGGGDPCKGYLGSDGYSWDELAPGVYTLRVDAGGWRPLSQPVEVAAGADARLTVHLDRGVPLEGLVVDEKGVPVQGLRLFASPVDPADPEKVLDESEEAWTDDDGTFRFEGLCPGPVAIVLGEGIKPYLLDGPFRAKAPATGVRIAVRHR